LIDNYLDNLGLVPTVPEDRKAKLKSAVASAFHSPAEMQKYLDTMGISERILDGLLASRIRSQVFVEQHLPFRVNVTDEEVRRYYEAEKSRKFLGKPFQSVAPIVRADLQQERVKKELEKWLETETNRTEVVFLNR
jgi:hypothetical protein